MKITVIVPSFNSEKFIAQCFESIVRQDHPNFEIIHIDGGSTDNTMAIAEKYKKHITYQISEKDKGQPDAVNKGLNVASGDILHWHASDDIILPGAFKEVDRIFENNEKIGLIYSDGWAFGSEGLLTYSSLPTKFLSFWETLLYFGRFQSDCAYWRHNELTANVRVNNSKPMICDEDFFLNIWALTKSAWTPVMLGAFRTHSDQFSNRESKFHVKSDRADTRNHIIKQMHHKKTQIAALKILYGMRYLIHKNIVNNFTLGFRKLSRIVTGDKKRKAQTLAFYSWIE